MYSVKIFGAKLNKTLNASVVENLKILKSSIRVKISKAPYCLLIVYRINVIKAEYIEFSPRKMIHIQKSGFHIKPGCQVLYILHTLHMIIVIMYNVSNI